MIEVWKAIKKFDELYQVSNLGRVKSIDRYVKGSRDGVQFKPGVELTQKISNNGYARVHIRCGKINSYPLVHRLVAEAFLENPDNLPQINHRDGNKLNNSVDNLEWCTAQYNVRHGLRNHLIPSGEDSHRAKLTWEKVCDIKAEYVRGSSEFGLIALAKKYGISKSMVSLIVRNEKWMYG